MEGFRKWMKTQKQWAEEHKDEVDEWRRAAEEWRKEVADTEQEGERRGEAGSLPHMPEIPPLPEMPEMPEFPKMPKLPSMVMFSKQATRSNVVASRIADQELEVVDMLIEAGLFNTRSEAVAFLVSEGVKARQDMVKKVSASLEEIRRVRTETEEQVARLRREVGLGQDEKGEVVSAKAEEAERICGECGRNLSGLPTDIRSCPYCGTRLT